MCIFHQLRIFSCYTRSLVPLEHVVPAHSQLWGGGLTFWGGILQRDHEDAWEGLPAGGVKVLAGNSIHGGQPLPLLVRSHRHGRR